MVLTGRGAKSPPCSPLHSLIIRLKPTRCHPLQRQLGSRSAPVGSCCWEIKVSKGRHWWGGGLLNHSPRPTQISQRRGKHGSRGAGAGDVIVTSATPEQRCDKPRDDGAADSSPHLTSRSDLGSDVLLGHQNHWPQLPTKGPGLTFNLHHLLHDDEAAVSGESHSHSSPWLPVAPHHSPRWLLLQHHVVAVVGREAEHHS